MPLRALVAAALALALVAAAPAHAQYWGYGPDESPPGANDFGCEPSAAHPEPVVLVHGLGANMQANWTYMSPRLAQAGFCVFALTYGRDAGNPPPFDSFGGTIAAEDSAAQIGSFIDRVLETTGARQVDVVGHSEGSIVPNHFAKFDPGARHADGTHKIDDYVGLTPLWDGTDVAFAATLRDEGGPVGQAAADLVASRCIFCVQALRGSEFIERMNEGGTPRVDPIAYTMVMTRYDELVVPYTSGIMDGARNVVLQELCPADPAEHLGVAVDPLAYNVVLNALDPEARRPEDCTAYREW